VVVPRPVWRRERPSGAASPRANDRASPVCGFERWRTQRVGGQDHQAFSTGAVRYPGDMFRRHVAEQNGAPSTAGTREGRRADTRTCAR
jgi:hypothetical protein